MNCQFLSCQRITEFPLTRPQQASMIYYQFVGATTLVINEEAYFMTPNSAIVVAPSDEFRVQLSNDNQFGYALHFYIDEQWHRHRERLFHVDAQLQSLLERLGTPIASIDDYVTIQSLFYRLLLNVKHCAEQEKPMNRFTALIQERFAEPLTVQDLATMADMNISTFSRTFKREVGMTPIDYLTEVRLTEAKKLLTYSHYSVRQIANEVGYEDEFYFSRVFKKKVGQSPSNYAKQHKKRIAITSQLFLQDHLIALGIEPYAAPSYPESLPNHNGFPSYLAPFLERTYAIPLEGTPLQESLNANLLITTPLHQPLDCTVSDETLALGHLANWDDYLREIAQFIDFEKKAETIIATIRQLERDARRQLLPFVRQRKWAIIWLRDNEIRLYGRHHHALSDLFYDQLGFPVADGITHDTYRTISLAELLIINPDSILLVWTEQARLDAIAAHPTWQSLQAVIQKRVFLPNSLEWDPWGPIGRTTMIRQCMDYFLHLAQ